MRPSALTCSSTRVATDVWRPASGTSVFPATRFRSLYAHVYRSSFSSSDQLVATSGSRRTSTCRCLSITEKPPIDSGEKTKGTCIGASGSFRSARQPIGLGDPMLAAIALKYGLELVTLRLFSIIAIMAVL